MSLLFAERVIVNEPKIIEHVIHPPQQVRDSHISARKYCRTVPALEGDLFCREVLTMLRQQPLIPCMVVCEAGSKPSGLIMRDTFYRKLTGRFAAEIYYSRPVHLFADMEALMIDINTAPQTIIELALKRPESIFYDCVILTENGQLKGVITVQDLMIMSGELQSDAEKQRKLTIRGNYTHVHEMEVSLKDVAEAAKETLDECHRMNEWTTNGRTKLDEVGKSYTKVVENMHEQQQQVTRLIDDVDTISSLTKGITELADKSGLLAINASIEAAHAGEHGRGFQIVAAEVRMLASQTRQFAADITKLLGSISRLATETGELTTSGVAEIHASAAYVSEGGKLFGELEKAVRNVENTGTSVHRLAESTAKQAADVKKELGSDLL